MIQISPDSLAQELTDGTRDITFLPDPLPCPPLALLTALHAQVRSYMRDGRPLAERAAEAAWAIAGRYPHNPLLTAQAYWSRATAILYRPAYAEALELYDEALNCYAQAQSAYPEQHITPDIRIVQVVRVFCLTELGRYAEALQAKASAEQWLEQNPHPNARLQLLLNSSLLAGNMGDYAQMLILANATIQYAQELGQIEDRAMGWINHAYACIYLGYFEQASTALSNALEDARSTDDSLTEARAILNRAWLFTSQGHFFDALQDLRRAEDGLREAPNEAATIALELATIYEHLRQLADAKRAAHRAALLYANQKLPMYSAHAYMRAMRIAVQLGRLKEAQKLLLAAEEQARKLDLSILYAQLHICAALIAAQAAAPDMTKKRRLVVQSMAEIAYMQLLEAGLYSEATEAQLALASLYVQLGQKKRACTIYQELIKHTSHTIRIAAHAQLGTILPVEEAYMHLVQAAALVVEQRRTLPMEELQARYSSETSQHHMQLAAVLLKQHKLIAVLHQIWEAKAGSLIDLRSASTRLNSVMQQRIDELRREISSFRNQEHAYQQKLMEAILVGHGEQQQHIESSLKNVVQARAIAEQKLIARVRILNDRTGQGQVPQFEELCAYLGQSTVALEYAHIKDDILCFVIQKGQTPTVYHIGTAELIERLVQRWNLVRHSTLGERFSEETTQRRMHILQALSDILIAPMGEILQQAKKILIAPVNMLHHIPWSILRLDDHLLLEQAEILLTPCIAFITHCFAAPPELDAPLLLGYAGDGYRYLPAVHSEIEAIARILPNANVRLPGSRADLQLDKAPCLLHIAAHGVTRPDAPICSYLELADGPFLLLEVHRLDLRGTRLVTLSACETGERPDYGEMSLAIAGAFLCAGAQAVLASLWAVDDHVAHMLMVHFYSALAEGQSASQSLRRAQQAIRNQYPLDWATFQLWVATLEE